MQMYHLNVLVLYVVCQVVGPDQRCCCVVPLDDENISVLRHQLQLIIIRNHSKGRSQSIFDEKEVKSDQLLGLPRSNLPNCQKCPHLGTQLPLLRGGENFLFWPLSLLFPLLVLLNDLAWPDRIEFDGLPFLAIFLES